MSICTSMLSGGSLQGNQIPMNIEWDRDMEEWDWSTVSNGLDLEVSPEEFWKKFEELPDLGDDLETLFAEVSGIGNTSPSSSICSDVLRNHDCMWGGTCHSKDHTLKATEPPSSPPPSAKQSPPRERKRTVIVQKSRSLLLNNRPNDVHIRPDTPQSLSESEEEPVTVRAVSASEVTGQVRRKTVPQCITPEVTSVQFDHNYDGKKLRTDDLGVQTPSDSEEEEEEVEEEEQDEEEEEVEEEEEEEEEEDDEDEEIDVVSLSSTRMPTIRSSTVRTIRTPAKTCYITSGESSPRNNHTLPTNPSKQMRTQIQDEMASAITTNSLISASKAVSRRLNGSMKRKRSSAPSTPARGRRRNSPAKKSRFSTGYLIDTEKRSLHNNMERMRRIDLRNAFEDLRQLVPTIADSQKAAKVTILKDATHYVRELHCKDRNLSAQLVALRREQERLRSTLSQLRRIFAIKNSQQHL